MTLGPAPDALPAVELRDVAAGTTFHRIHRRSPGRGSASFNPCLGGPTRFAPLYADDPMSPGGRRCVPTLYVGETFEAALFESVFRDLPPAPAPALRRVFESMSVVGASHATLVSRRLLRFVPLFQPSLHLLGLTRADLIDGHGTAAYALTVTWAAAMHRDYPDADGLAWTSRQNDEAKAYILFGDRAEDALEVETDVPIDAGPGYRRLAAAAARYGVELVPPPSPP